MRRVLLPITTTLLGGIVGPIGALFPLGFFVPFWLMLTIFGGFLFAVLPGFLFGLTFSLLPTPALQKFFQQERGMRWIMLAALGASCGVLFYPVMKICFWLGDHRNSSLLDYLLNGSSEDTIFMLSILAYGGAWSSFVLWLPVKWLLKPYLQPA